MSPAMDLASWDALQTAIAFAGLFLGGYAGAHAGAVQRLRMEERRYLWAEIEQTDRELRRLERAAASELHNLIVVMQNVEIPEAPSELRGEIASYSQAAEDQYTRWIATLGDVTPRVQLLPLSERLAFDSYRRTLPDRAVMRVFVECLSFRMLVSFRAEYEPVERWTEHRARAMDESRLLKLAEELESAVEDERTLAMTSFRDHLHRRLRPGWWRRIADIRFTIRLGCSSLGRRWNRWRKRRLGATPPRP